MTGRSTRAQRIQPGAYEALVEALANVFWYKDDLREFVRRRVGGDAQLLAAVEVDGYKWAIAKHVVARLEADENRYRDVTIQLMLDVAQMDTFPTLARHGDAAVLVPRAKNAVAALAKWTERHQAILDEREEHAADLEAYRAQVAVQQGFNAKLAALHGQFLELEKMQNRQKAGRLFEPFLNQLFHLFDLEPRLSYNLAYEQIDGSLTFDTDDYIIEAKWWKERVEANPLYGFNEKVRRKGKNALGLFISVNGFTSGALEAFREGTSFHVMDGGDLICVLEGRISLVELLRRKKRHANETGNCYFPAFMALD